MIGIERRGNMIIGVSGYARAGKDTVADILVKNHGFIKLHFADKLRDALYALDPLVGIEGEPFEGGLDYVSVQMVIDRHGWDGYKETEHGTEIRRLLQRLGTEAGRQTLGENVWVNALRNEISKTQTRPHDRPNIVIPDARFPNEARMIEEVYDGSMWRVERPGVEAINSHASETELDDWNFHFTIQNNSSIDVLENTVRHCWELLVAETYV